MPIYNFYIKEKKMLVLKNIKKDYVTSSETVHALKGIDIAFRDREFVSILGPSGCGKTTLLNIVGGLDRYTSGDLEINGVSTKLYRDRDWDVYRNHRVGFIFQSYNLIPHQTVLGNVELALTIAGISKEERVERAKAALDKVGLSGQYYKRPNQLSGGQCQRVAIARALVNDPEILLADEPTGALDTVTSVQIMNLIREIAGERLVIMVTHNPELAVEYSTRIVRLLDGELQEDSNPISEEELEAYKKAEAERIASEKEEVRRAEEAARAEGKKIKKAKKKEKAKMSFFTAFRLSARNLLSKKGRTSMIGIAGSIGIVGIAMVLAFSAGIKGYIASMQDDMLSGNPITITETAYDLSALTGMMENSLEESGIKFPGKVNISSLVDYIASLGKLEDQMAVENDISAEYIEYLKAMNPEDYVAMLFDYGIDLNSNVYTSFKQSADSEGEGMSITALTAMYTSILKETEFSEYADYVSMLVPSFAQMPSSEGYILSQYDLLGDSRFATEAGEIMLVLDADDAISDLLLARFGFYTQDEFLEIVNKAMLDEEGKKNYDNPLYRDYFEYDELIGRTLTWYPNSEAFSSFSYPNPMTGTTVTTYTHNAYSAELEGGLELKVVGILTPKDTVSFGSLSSGIYYTEALTEYMLEKNADSDIFDYINAIDESDTTQAALASYYFTYRYNYSYDKNGDGAITDDEKKSNQLGMVGPTMTAADMMSSMMGSSSSFSHQETKERLIRNLGGNPFANSVKIYPHSFDEKFKVTEYLDKWNSELKEGESFSFTATDGSTVTLTKDEKSNVTYTDSLELIINLINTMIEIISVGLIAFTSVSLVVSTVMIGIITYVSVVERIKEIGVIRSLGGRKRDVSNLFIAETFIIGLLAGLIGVGFTYFASIIVNLILKPIIGYGSIAALPLGNAVLLVALSVGLTLISGLMPASSAARKDPVVALRTE